MPASSSASRQRKTDSVVSAALQAARNGSLVNLLDLAEYVKTAPAHILPDVFEVFLEHLNSRRILLRSRGMKELYPFVSAALIGLTSLIALHGFKKFIKPQRLHSEWTEIIDTLIACYENAKTLGNTHRTSLVAKFAVDVLDHLMAIIKPADGTLPAFRNEKSQTFFYSIWLHEWPDTTIAFECASSVSYCLKMDERSYDYLLKAASGPCPAKTVADIASQRMKAALDEAAPTTTKEKFQATQCYAIACITDESNHELAQAVFESDAFNVIMRFMRILLRRSAESGRTLSSASSCFFFLRQIFDHRPKTICKAIKKGFIGILCHFMPLLERVRARDEQIFVQLQHILTETLPSELVYNDTIAAMTDAVRRMPVEKRKLMREGILGKYWSTLEVQLVERFATLRVHTLRLRMAHCHTCGKHEFLTALKKCARCGHVVYCSKDCQALEWTTFGHKMTCGNGLNTIAKRRRFTNIADFLASRDTQRHIAGAATQTLGSFCRFEPSKHLVRVNYTTFPVVFEVIELSEFLKAQPSAKKSLSNAALKLQREWEDPECPTRIMCLKDLRRGLQNSMLADSMELNPITMHTTELPDGRKRELPRAAVRVVARTASGREKKLIVDPKVDTLDSVLAECGSTVEDFWEIRDFDEIVLTWLKHLNSKSLSPY